MIEPHNTRRRTDKRLVYGLKRKVLLVADELEFLLRASSQVYSIPSLVSTLSLHGARLPTVDWAPGATDWGH